MISAPVRVVFLLAALLASMLAGAQTVAQQIASVEAMIAHFQQTEARHLKLIQELERGSVVMVRMVNESQAMPMRTSDIRDYYVALSIAGNASDSKPDVAKAEQRGQVLATKLIASCKQMSREAIVRLNKELSQLRSSRQKAQTRLERLRQSVQGTLGNFSGTWYSSVGRYAYRHDLVMTQTGDRVTGTWTHAGGTGTIEGTVKDRTLTFKWTATGADGGSDRGTGKWEINRENNSFSGTYSSDRKDGEKNNGWRGHKLKSAAEGGELTIELTYPIGKSPKVFTRGWTFGAKATGPGGTDLSSKVTWSGTGSFSSSIGARSMPTFSDLGRNTITLAVEHGGKRVSRSFTIEAVDPAGYARVGTFAHCPSDSHGCTACPHAAVGAVTSGSSTVLIDGYPAARVGDGGTHTACCGPNTFTIVEGDPEVLIDGKRAAKMDSKTKHCGGTGTLASKG